MEWRRRVAKGILKGLLDVNGQGMLMRRFQLVHLDGEATYEGSINLDMSSNQTTSDSEMATSKHGVGLVGSLPQELSSLFSTRATCHQ